MSKVLSDDKVFEIIHAFTAYWERDLSGGYTNSSSDRGGLTRNGITLGFLKSLPDKELADLNQDGKITNADVLLADPDTAKRLFRYSAWEQGKAKLLPNFTAMAYYDFAVNSGFPRAAICLQKAIDSLRPGTIVNYAGNVGPKTQQAVQQFIDPELDYKLAVALMKEREKFLRGVADSDPVQMNNLNGWINRVNACYKLIVQQYEYNPRR